MKFCVDQAIFEKLPAACFGVVVAKGIDNRSPCPEAARLLDEGIALAERLRAKRSRTTPPSCPIGMPFVRSG